MILQASSDPAAEHAPPGLGRFPALAALLARAPGLRGLQAKIVESILTAVDHAGLTLLLLASGALLLRPADLIPALTGWPVYGVLMACCLAVSTPRLVSALSWRALRRNGLMALMLLLVPAVMLSHLVHLNTYDARLDGLEAAKACALFVLFVVQVDSIGKLKSTMLVIIGAVFAVTVVAILHFHGVVNLPTLRVIAAKAVGVEGEAPLLRLCGVGVFDDPNDFCMLLVTAAALCVYGLGERSAGRARWALLAPLALFGYAILLTQSRGGLLSAVAAGMAFLWFRIGWRNALPLFGLLALFLAAPFWGRQANVDLSDPDDTFQSRLGLWSDALELFRAEPFFGIGRGRLADAIGQVAHNSYLHAFTELGLLGGSAFLGAFDLAIRGLRRAAPADRDVRRLRPYVFALIVGYAIGLLTLSRCYTVPTQLVLALATVYLALASQSGPVVLPRLDAVALRRIATATACLLGATYLFVRILIVRG